MPLLATTAITVKMMQDNIVYKTMDKVIWSVNKW